MGSTSMACPPKIMQRETEFLHALGATTQFQVSGDSLKLLGAEGKVLMELIVSE
jgi:heat shock protein HslJ